jgi:ketosteroid isomerase-like protein
VANGTDNVALAYRLFADLRTGGIDAMRPYLHDEIVLVEASELPDASTYRGKDPVAARIQERMDLGFRYDIEIERADALDANRVLTALKVHRSDMDLSFGWWQIGTWRNGLLVEIREFLDGPAARKAAGLAD